MAEPRVAPARGRSYPRRQSGSSRTRAGAKRPASATSWRRRLVAAAIVSGVLLIGLPLAHAFLGELGAVLVGTLVLGFALGRMTLKR